MKLSAALRDLSQRLGHEFRDPLPCGGGVHVVGASVGVALGPFLLVDAGRVAAGQAPAGWPL